MEAKHKKFLEAFLKETLFNFEDIAKSLVEAKIISKETIDDILVSNLIQKDQNVIVNFLLLFPKGTTDIRFSFQCNQLIRSHNQNKSSMD